MTIGETQSFWSRAFYTFEPYEKLLGYFDENDLRKFQVLRTICKGWRKDLSLDNLVATSLYRPSTRQFFQNVGRPISALPIRAEYNNPSFVCRVEGETDGKKKWSYICVPVKSQPVESEPDESESDGFEFDSTIRSFLVGTGVELSEYVKAVLKGKHPYLKLGTIT